MSNLPIIKKMVDSDKYKGIFFIIGEAKCGTTSLFDYMCMHPSIVKPKKKELRHFRQVNLVRTYKSVENIPKEELKRIADDHLQLLMPNPSEYKDKEFMIGEASGYVKDEWSIKILKKVYPESRHVLLLRNPVDRIYSWYWHSKQPRRRRKRKSKILGFEKEIHRYLKVKSNFYYDNLKTYSKYFDLDDLLIIKSEDFFAEPNKYTNIAFEHVGLSKHSLGDLKPKNTGRYNESMGDDIRKFLEEHFSEQNKNLYELIGRDMEW